MLPENCPLLTASIDYPEGTSLDVKWPEHNHGIPSKMVIIATGSELVKVLSDLVEDHFGIPLGRVFEK